MSHIIWSDSEELGHRIRGRLVSASILPASDSLKTVVQDHSAIEAGVYEYEVPRSLKKQAVTITKPSLHQRVRKRLVKEKPWPYLLLASPIIH